MCARSRLAPSASRVVAVLARFGERGVAPSAVIVNFTPHIFAALPVVVVSYTMHYNGAAACRLGAARSG